MRIAQVVESLEVGGLERMALDLALAQKAAGHQVFIYCLLRGGPLVKEAQAADIPIRLFSKQPGMSLQLPVRLAGRFFRDRIDVMHSHNPAIHPYAAIGARMAGARAVINTRHGTATSTGRLHDERRFKISIPFSDHLAFVSEHSRRVFLDATGTLERRTSVIANGIQVERFLAKPAAPGAMRPRIRFGTVGRTVPAKGHSVLIDAFSLLTARLPEADLRIVGDGQLFDELCNQVRHLGLTGRIKLEGARSDVEHFLHDLDVFVFSSVNEGLPLAILEAMAAGLPIVSTRVGGVPEVAPEGQVAWYCPIGDPAELAAVMYQAAVSPELAARGRRAMELAVSRYSTRAMQQSYEAVYRECIAR